MIKTIIKHTILKKKKPNVKLFLLDEGLVIEYEVFKEITKDRIIKVGLANNANVEEYNNMLQSTLSHCLSPSKTMAIVFNTKPNILPNKLPSRLPKQKNIKCLLMYFLILRAKQSIIIIVRILITLVYTIIIRITA